MLKLPGLQRVGHKLCVCCASPADNYCAGCAITPYCSVTCQRRDWNERHKDVCHNLLKTSVAKEIVQAAPVIETSVPAAAPLRRPHAVSDQYKRRDDDTASNTSKALNNIPYNKNRSPQQNNMKEKNNQPDRRITNGQRSGNNKQENRENNNGPRSDNNSVQDSRNRGNTRGTDNVDASNFQKPQMNNVQDEPVQKTQAPPKPVLHKIEPEPAPLNTTPVPQPAQPAVTSPSAPALKPMSRADVTPQKRQLVPKSYLVNDLSVGDLFLLSVDSPVASCRQVTGEFVCLSMSDSHEQHYQRLCEEYVLACDADEQTYRPNPGEACSYFNVEDGSWYRARCLNANTLALLDSSKLVSIQDTDKIRKLQPPYDAMSEFCCVLHSKATRLEANLICTVLSKSEGTCVVSMQDSESGKTLGDAEVTRWLPTVDYPVAAAVPEVSRPALANNSRVVLVHAESLDQVYIRPADTEIQRKYDQVLQNVLLAAMKSEPLKEPPLKGQTVIGKFTDGIHYRALCKRVNVAKNKYMLEYIDFGNVAVQRLEDIYPCPSTLDVVSCPALVSVVRLRASPARLTAPALARVDELRDKATELVVTSVDGSASIPSGSLATLSEAGGASDVGAKLAQLSAPQWSRLQDEQVDILDVPPVMYCSLQFPSLSRGGCSLRVTDVSVLQDGTVCGYDMATPGWDEQYGPLEEQLEAYCNSPIGSEPYLPRTEEVCIAKSPKFGRWQRAVVLEQEGGPGSGVVYLLFVDSGRVEHAPFTHVRKALTEFVQRPARVTHVDINNFPKPATAEQIALAKQYMNIDDSGCGVLKLTKCVKDDSVYICDAPGLIDFITKA